MKSVNNHEWQRPVVGVSWPNPQSDEVWMSALVFAFQKAFQSSKVGKGPRAPIICIVMLGAANSNIEPLADFHKMKFDVF